MFSYESQVQHLIEKCAIKRKHNKIIIDYYNSVGDTKRAENIRKCATWLGFTNIGGVAHIVKSDFCRNRLCYICAWRRQAKFTAQMRPCLDMLANDGFRFVFVTLTMKNVIAENARSAVGEILKAYDCLLHKAKIKRAWLGCVRSVEMTYNKDEHTYHPHIHMLVAVKKSYFTDSNLYISQLDLSEMWRKSLKCDYTPCCHIETVKDKAVGALETIKYAIKPTEHKDALSTFDIALRGRRLVSFSGVIAKMRHALKFSDFENINIDDEVANDREITFDLYKFDVSGGVYNFMKSYTEKR